MTTTITQTKIVLNVGCGPIDDTRIEAKYLKPPWEMVRLDIDPKVQPDIVANITDMKSVRSGWADMLWSRHNLEHLYYHEVPLALKEFCRVLKPRGTAIILLPNLQMLAKHLAQGKLEEPLYGSPAGAISAIDMLYGHRDSIRKGNHFMSHKTGFTTQTLAQKLTQAGFRQARIQCQRFQIKATAVK